MQYAQNIFDSHTDCQLLGTFPYQTWCKLSDIFTILSSISEYDAYIANQGAVSV